MECHVLTGSTATPETAFGRASRSGFTWPWNLHQQDEGQEPAGVEVYFPFATPFDDRSCESFETVVAPAVRPGSRVKAPDAALAINRGLAVAPTVLLAGMYGAIICAATSIASPGVGFALCA